MAALAPPAHCFEELIQHTPLAIVLGFDRAHEVRLWNRAAERFFGLSTHQARGRRLFDLFLVPEEGEELIALIERCTASGLPCGPREFGITMADGLRWLLLSLYPLSDGEIVAMGVDITAQKALEQELRQHRDHLEELVRARTAELIAAKEAAERAAAMKAEFLAQMSHELRTPMHAILSFARLGHDKAAMAPPEKLQDFFLRIQEGGERLLKMINDLLDLSRLEAGRMRYDFAPHDLRECVAAVVEELSPLLASKGLRCAVAATVEDGRLVCDRPHIEQVVRNLLGNAIKFSPPASEVKLEIAAVTVPAGRRAEDAHHLVPGLRLSVSDSGPGIPEDELEAVFEKFVQSSRNKPGAGGSGLGLAICRQIVRDHRGEIRARNLAGGGAAFDVLLPRRSEEFA
ncbi:MAG: PAS domain-containing sensor histidine kinase [Rhodocyclaceae bacterium]|nr:PAS domain-containing sensor histidine kinase [Rhodocyclaceae bacterium]